jgi:macrolide-specific efflux system membrane fusion protein
VDQALVTVSNTSAVQCTASIDLSAHPINLLSGMNATIEVVAGEALNALLVPVEALRDNGSGQYFVFVVKSNGELEMRTVEVGLKDAVNAEILSGLAEGEVVTLNTSSGSSTLSTESSPFDSTQQMPAGMPFPGGGQP